MKIIDPQEMKGNVFILILIKHCQSLPETTMNFIVTLWICFLLDLCPSWSKNGKNKNLIEVNNGKFLASTTRSVQVFGTQLSYEPSELRAIKDQKKHDKRFKTLPFGAIRWIRELQINRRRQKTSIKSQPKQLGVNHNNLIHIRPTNTESQFYTSNLNIAMVNVRSLKICEQQVLNEIIKGNIDVLVITETWLSDIQDDAHWIQASDLNKEPLTCQTFSRVGRRGGGLALVCKSCLKPSLKHTFQNQALKAVTWMITNKNMPIWITGVYHPPPGKA